MKQKIIEYEGIKILCLENETGERFYPITYTCKNILKRLSRVNMDSIKNGKIYELEVNFDLIIGTGSIQKVYCFDNDALKYYLNNLRLGSLKTDESVYNYKKLCKYIGIEDRKIIKEEMDDYCIDKLKDYKNKEFDYKKCNKCGLELPVNIMFFHKDDRRIDGYGCTCKRCLSGKFYNKDNNGYLDYIYSKYGNDIYVKMRDLIKNKKEEIIFEMKMKGEIDKVIHIDDKNKIIKIIKHLVNVGLLNENNLTIECLLNVFEVKNLHIKIEEIYNKIYPDWKVKYYKYPSISVGITIEDAKKTFKNYIKENNIIINDDNVYDIDYRELFKNARLSCFSNKDILYFIMYVTNNKYGSYKFKVKNEKYYKEKENRISALKYYIKKDLKLKNIERIPIYVTKNKMRKNSGTLYNLLRKYYNSSIFNWVDECYPNKFTKDDFSNEVIRNEFDSNDEQMIDEILRYNFKYGLIHNVSSNNYTVRLFSKQPDWFILTDNYCWIVEYWGMWSEVPTSSMFEMYKEKYDIKTEIYKNNLGYYKHLWIYPYDLNNNFKGLYDKIEKVKLVDKGEIDCDIVE